MKNSKQPAPVTLVLGGTGKVGRRIIKRLTNRGVLTRIGSRSTAPCFDWNDPAGWDIVLDGVKSVFLSYAPDLAIPGATGAVSAFVDLAASKGVKRLVLLSGRGEKEAQRCERIVQDAGIQWTVVRCSWFNQNFSEGEFLDMVLAGAITLPAGDVREPFVDAGDIADVAAAALTEDGHAGQIYEVTGPRMLTFSQAAAEISRATGRDIRYIRIPHDDFVSGIAESGAGEEITWLLDYLFSTVLDGTNAYLGDGVLRALGRKPTDFADYARKAADAGTWDVPPANFSAVA